jgi:oxaloacetate decarboxylase beta subunit
MKKITAIFLTIIGSIIMILSLIVKVKEQIIIDGSDGPTSIFLAGKVGSNLDLAGIIVGAVLLAAGIFMLVKSSLL